MTAAIGLRIAFAVAALLLAVGLVLDIRATLAGWLVAWVAVSAIPIGALGILMMTYLVRRAWTPALYPILASATATLPVAALLFIAVLLWMPELYPAAADPGSLPPFKAFYLSRWFFTLRAVLYFAVWWALALWLRAAWGDLDRMTRAASAGLIVYVLSLSLAGIDWMESLEPKFHSSIYGLLSVSFALLNGLAFAVAAGLWLRRARGKLKGYGAMLLSEILLWAYLHAMQYIVIWSANIPSEVKWYLDRSAHGWQIVVIVLAFGQLILPFFALLSERIRGDRRWLLALSGLTLMMRCLEAAILILPAVPQTGPAMTGAMLSCALVFIGCALWWAFEAAYRDAWRPLELFGTRARVETGSG